MNYDKTINIIDNCIYYIIEYGYSYNTNEIFNSMINNKDQEYLLNYYLSHIKKNYHKDNLNIIYKLCNNIFKHFIFPNNMNKKRNDNINNISLIIKLAIINYCFKLMK